MDGLIYLLAAEADLSLDEQQSLLCGALREQFGFDDEGNPKFYLFETFSDYLIARSQDGKLYRVPYTLAGDSVFHLHRLGRR